MIGFFLACFFLIMPFWKLYGRIVTPKLLKEIEDISRKLGEHPSVEEYMELSNKRRTLWEKVDRANMKF